MVVFDKAYNYYHQFALWTQNQVYFVSHLKTNAVYIVEEVTRRHYREKGIAKVLNDEIIQMEYHPEDDTGQKQMKITNQLRLRKVCYQDEKNRYYGFVFLNMQSFLSPGFPLEYGSLNPQAMARASVY